MAAGLLAVSATWAAAAPAPSVSGTKLKWQAHRAAGERAMTARLTGATTAPPADAEKAIEASTEVATRQAPSQPRPLQQASAPSQEARAPIRRGWVPHTVTRSAAARTQPRDTVMQVSADGSDALKDPFEDEPLGNRPDNATTDVAREPDDLAPSSSAADEPPRLRGGDDPLPDQKASQFNPADVDTLPDNRSIVEGTAPPEAGVSCDDYKAECDRAIDKLRKRDITKIIFGIVIEGEGGRPPVEGRDYPCECTLGTNAKFEGRAWEPTTFTWKATGVCHKPLYFEDVQLERYGHSWNPVVQPFMSAAHFFISVPLLPYKMGLNPPCECVYSLGYYRPGNCAPYMIEPLPLSLRGAVFEAFAATGFAFWFWPPPNPF